ncbi:MAG: hypothetical protein IZT56_07970 [Bacteroidetes bacterium]|nr:hypothetical protein [Bacteroidota bacterium]
MSNISRCLIIVFVFVSISCKNEIKDKNSTFETALGEKLNIPKDLTIYKPFEEAILDSTEIINSELKIFTRVNVSCATCINDIQLGWLSI